MSFPSAFACHMFLIWFTCLCFIRTVKTWFCSLLCQASVVVISVVSMTNGNANCLYPCLCLCQVLGPCFHYPLYYVNLLLLVCHCLFISYFFYSILCYSVYWRSCTWPVFLADLCVYDPCHLVVDAAPACNLHPAARCWIVSRAFYCTVCTLGLDWYETQLCWLIYCWVLVRGSMLSCIPACFFSLSLIF